MFGQGKLTEEIAQAADRQAEQERPERTTLNLLSALTGEANIVANDKKNGKPIIATDPYAPDTPDSWN